MTRYITQINYLFMLSFLSFKLAALPLLEQISIVTFLLVTVVFFLILLILGVLKSFKLKAENERLSKTNSPTPTTEGDNKVYKDFREGHLYDDY